MPTQTQTKSKRETSHVVIDFLDLDTSKFSFMPPKKNQHGGKMINIKYGGKNLYVRYPKKTNLFGISSNTEKNASYENGKKITGYTLSVSFGHKDSYDQDPYYQKALELDEFFIDQCIENSMLWGLGGTKTNPKSRDHFSGDDDKGANGAWKRLVKWSYKVDEDTGERVYQDYAPRYEAGVPAVITEEADAKTGIKTQSAVFKSGVFNDEGEQFDEVTSENCDAICPAWSDTSVLARWPRITQGTYGATLKPQVHQLRVYPREELSKDECLLDDDDEDGVDLGDEGFAAPSSSHAEAEVEEEDELEDGGVEYVDTEDVDTEDVVEVVEESAPVAAPKRRVAMRRVVKKN